MSAEEYQRAVGDMLRSPDLCIELRRAGPAPAGPSGPNGQPMVDPLAGYRLTTRERARLYAMSAHRGMVVNCTLYRASRLVGITRRLPRTVQLLGPRLRDVFDAYLAAQPDADPEFDREAARFAAFVTSSTVVRSAVDSSLHDVLRDVVAAELADIVQP